MGFYWQPSAMKFFFGTREAFFQLLMRIEDIAIESCFDASCMLE